MNKRLSTFGMSLFSEVRDYKPDRIQAQKKQPKNFHVVSKKRSHAIQYRAGKLVVFKAGGEGGSLV